jgi:hypothetical protein
VDSRLRVGRGGVGRARWTGFIKGFGRGVFGWCSFLFGGECGVWGENWGYLSEFRGNKSYLIFITPLEIEGDYRARIILEMATLD